jgi:hypothetical protein
MILRSIVFKPRGCERPATVRVRTVRALHLAHRRVDILPFLALLLHPALPVDTRGEWSGLLNVAFRFYM